MRTVMRRPLSAVDGSDELDGPAAATAAVADEEVDMTG